MQTLQKMTWLFQMGWTGSGTYPGIGLMGVKQSTKSNTKFKNKSLSVRRTKLLFFIFVQLRVSAINITPQSKVTKHKRQSSCVQRNVSDLFF